LIVAGTGDGVVVVALGVTLGHGEVSSPVGLMYSELSEYPAWRVGAPLSELT